MKQNNIESYARSVTRWIGSPSSVVLHTLAFITSFGAVWFGVLPFDRMLLVLTTVVSLEAIYLSIFIQMSLNLTTESLQEVAEDVDAIQQDIDEIQEDVDEIQEDVGEIQEDVDELQEDVEEMSEEEGKEAIHAAQHKTLEEIRAGLQKLLSEVEQLQEKE